MVALANQYTDIGQYTYFLLEFTKIGLVVWS